MNVNFKRLTKKNLVKSKGGFTLVELLITIALLGIITVPVGAALILGLRIFDNEVAIDQTFQEQQESFIEIKEYLRLNPYDVQIATTTEGVVELSIGTGGNNRVYYLSAGQLMRRIDGNTIVICNQVTQFTLDSIIRDSSNVVVGFSMTLIATERDRENKLTASIALRRY